jgi:hypothetical protein
VARKQLVDAIKAREKQVARAVKDLLLPAVRKRA